METYTILYTESHGETTEVSVQAADPMEAVEKVFGEDVAALMDEFPKMAFYKHGNVIDLRL